MTLSMKKYLLPSIYTGTQRKNVKCFSLNSEECVFYFAGQILFNNMIFYPLLDKLKHFFSVAKRTYLYIDSPVC